MKKLKMEYKYSGKMGIFHKKLALNENDLKILKDILELELLAIPILFGLDYAEKFILNIFKHY
ncbi:hypothetical protein [Flagellimonas nanhaiensis]|uniref:hypothetical protein n=1 Tax=Flagellimonas nanhaiensis TaxID=2292706 RepID=UPI0011C03EF3|nr:hypothetical protein [Allomuricauda nanhaiensis]